MRLLITVCAVTLLSAAAALADEPSGRLSVGARLGFGSVGIPGLSGEKVLDLGAVVQRRVSETTSFIGGVGYQRVPGVSYADRAVGPYRGHLLSGFVGYKSRLMRSPRTAYLGSTVGLTHWSGRPGDQALSPSVGAFLGMEMPLAPRSRLFVEYGMRFGKPRVAAGYAHWSLGLGYTKGF